jgi:uncharacterized cupin superfamily protein/GNAT superfamily N-acetyltransferase
MMQEWNKEFERYAGHFSDFGDPNAADDPPDDGTKIFAVDIGRKVGFARIAAHHVVLPPGCRTSRPHAESLEEEFVFVLRGTPYAWIDGYVYPLKEGHAVGFPAGTGIAHTFINNTDSDVHLLVAGERTKKENRFVYPLSPDLANKHDAWWHEAPKRALGRHRGLPGSLKAEDLGRDTPPFVLSCPDVRDGRAFHYPGDNETFGHGFRLTDRLGLKALGIRYERLAPGRRSSFPHAHTHEEEFVYVLGGQPTVWLNGFTKRLGPEQVAAFPSGTGLAHTLINDSDDLVTYICIGETREFPDEKIIYPCNALRQRECERKNWAWAEPPTQARGPHLGSPRLPFPDHLAFRACTERDAETVSEVFKGSPAYFERVDGCAPTLELARHAILDQPPKTGDSYFKECLLIESRGRPVGVLDLHAHHPEPGICYLGLLLLRDRDAGKGFGRRCYELAEDYVRRAYGCKLIQLGVSADNDVSGFWTKMGFANNGKTYEWRAEAKTTAVTEMEKSIEAGAAS